MKQHEFNEICKTVHNSAYHIKRMDLIGDLIEIFVDKMECQETWDAFDEMRTLIRMLKEFDDIPITSLSYQIQMNANSIRDNDIAREFAYLMYLLRRYIENISCDEFTHILWQFSLIASNLMESSLDEGRAFVFNILQSRVQFRTS